MRCSLGWHKWISNGYYRFCLRCRKQQYWVPDYQNSGWELGGFEPGHWVDSNENISNQR